MPDPEPHDERTDAITKRLTARVKVDLGNAWESVLSDKDRWLVESVCADAAELLLEGLAVGRDSPEHKALLAETLHVEAQLANVAAAVQTGLVEAFRAAMRETVATLIGLAFRAA